MPTPEQERARIAGVYAGMSDEELQRLARSGDEFTPIAQEAFDAEVARRGLNITIVSPSIEAPTDPGPLNVESEDGVIEFDRTVTLRRYLYLPEALLAKGTLESAGIQAYVIDENMIRLDWFVSNAIGGLRLQVHEKDVDAANEILNQPIPEVFQADGAEEYQQPRCPKCGSLNVNYREMLKSLFSRDDVVVWSCAACRNVWQGDSDGVPQLPQK